VISSAGSPEISVASHIVVYLGFGEHAIVFEHGFAKIGTIVGNNHHLDVAFAQGLERLRETYR